MNVLLHRLTGSRAPALLALLPALLLAVGIARADTPQTDLPRLALTAGIHRIDAQVAATPSQRQIGLMWRRDMPQNEGMLFIFEQPSVQCFWMKNTLLPLTAAFVADDGSIVNLADMKPQTTDSHCSAKPVRYVLEMNQGWFARRGLAAGSRLAGLPTARP
ncbi:MAG: hypothetical protein RLZZ180_2202 [Pseudomonadota bacterium]|jgi:uncharacterized membrane protein (UPF0127 family)